MQLWVRWPIFYTKDTVFYYTALWEVCSLLQPIFFVIYIRISLKLVYIYMFFRTFFSLVDFNYFNPIRTHEKAIYEICNLLPISVFSPKQVQNYRQYLMSRNVAINSKYAFFMTICTRTRRNGFHLIWSCYLKYITRTRIYLWPWPSSTSLIHKIRTYILAIRTSNTETPSPKLP